MKISNLIAKLKNIDVPFDADLTDGEFGPFCQRLIEIKIGAPFVLLVFGDGQGMKTEEAIDKLENIVAELPFDATVTNRRLGDDHQELQRVYHEPPVTILDFSS